MKVVVSARRKLRDLGYLRRINRVVNSDVAFISRHYNQQGVFYIQIGGAGLFYMEQNPLKLPVPKLEGRVKLKFRLAYSGGAKNPPFFPTSPITPARFAALRISAWLQSKNKSNFTLEKVENIEEMLATVTAQRALAAIRSLPIVAA